MRYLTAEVYIYFNKSIRFHKYFLKIVTNTKYFTFPISPWNWLFVSHHVCKYSVELNVHFPFP